MIHFDNTVPKQLTENLAYRLELRKWATGGRDRQQYILDHCKDGLVGRLFWFNAFCWVFEPRLRRADDGTLLPQILPFITWPHQDVAIETLVKDVGFDDIGIEKSRGEGASWVVLMEFLFRFLFYEMQAFGLVSRNEDAVDRPNDPDCLMWKLDWQLKRLPNWMTGAPHSIHRSVRDHTLLHRINNSTIVGYSATGDVASGGRKTAFLMDEMAKFPRSSADDAMNSTEPVTESRIIVSTPKGATGAYYKAMKDTSSNMRRIRLHWTDNPTRNRGLYRVVNGHPIEVDPVNNPLPAGYRLEWPGIRQQLIDRGFDITKGLRSPWYDKRCLRAKATPLSIAQEYDIDYQGSAARFFSVPMIERLLSSTAQQPLIRGDLLFTTDGDDWDVRFVENPEGPLKIWIPIWELRNRPPDDRRYVCGADIASGQAGNMSANSVDSVAEQATGRKVAEYTTNTLSPEEFAHVTIALCKFFNGMGSDAYLGWENNGCGGNFRKEVERLRYSRIYMRTTDDIRKRKSLKPGWTSNHASKRLLLTDYQHALQQGKFINPCIEAINELRAYSETVTGAIEHDGESVEDGTGGKFSHGDRVIADAIANMLCDEYRSAQRVNAKTAPAGPVSVKTFAYRQQQASKSIGKRRGRSAW